MASLRRMHDGIFWIGVNDFDTALFEGYIPLPKGVTYNSYIVVDDKIALIDAVKETVETEFFSNIEAVIGTRAPDYLIVNHMEPDHSGAITALFARYPNLTVVGNKKTLEFLSNFYRMQTVRTLLVEDGQTLSLGTRTLTFHLTPMTHWPETMVTHESKTNTLFTGDIFGGFGTLNGGAFDDEIDVSLYENEARRYYANIVGKYSAMALKAIEKLKNIPITSIAPTHGVIYRTNPERILSLYTSWSKQELLPGAVIAFASMYGNTRKMADAVAQGLSEGGVKTIRMYDVSKTDASFILSDIWRYKGLALGSCTHDGGIFPLMGSLIAKLENKKIQHHTLGIFASYTWSGGAMKRLTEYAEQSRMRTLEPAVDARSSPTNEDIENLILLGTRMAEEIR